MTDGRDWRERAIDRGHTFTEVKGTGLSCPYCDTRLAGHEALEAAATPTPGDYSLCLGCLRLIVYAHDLSLRRPTEQEEEEFRTAPEYAASRHEVVRVIADEVAHHIAQATGDTVGTDKKPKI